MASAESETLHRHRSDPDEWDDRPANIKVRPSPAEVVSFRLPGHELDRLQEAAAAEGMTLSQFIRDALEQRLRGDPQSSLGDVSSGHVKLTLGDEWPRRRSAVSASGVAVLAPPYPPEAQSVTSSEGARHCQTREDRLPLEP